MKKLDIFHKSLFILALFVGLAYLFFMGIILYELWIESNPTGCGTPQAWGMMGFSLIYLPLGIGLGIYQLWKIKATHTSPGWKRFGLINALFLFSLSLLGIIMFTGWLLG